MELVVILVWLVLALVSAFALYWIIRLAITHALREHTLNAIWAVTVKDAPARVTSTD